MKGRYLLGAGAAVALLLGSAQAQAQMFPSGPGTFYFGGEGGWTHLDNQTDRARLGPPVNRSGSGRARFDDGYNVGARLGYQWGPWRIEEEYSYRHNGLAGLSVPASLGLGPISGVHGDRNAHAIMTNVLYDFTFGWPITPHLGFGVGAVDVEDSLNFSGVAGGHPFTARTRGNDWVFGYQAIAGIEYNINRSLALDLDYRYLGTTNPSYAGNASVSGISGLSTIPGHFRSGYSSHNFVASLIFRFGAPPPPPPVTPAAAAPAAPPPPPHQVYLVFFNWDRYNVTPEGQKIIHQAAEHWHSGSPVRIEVTGYTDLSGSAGYNLRLSQRRAAAVRHALEQDGVPRNDMVVKGLGESHPRVPTANGVREPQNRRVEIVFP